MFIQHKQGHKSQAWPESMGHLPVTAWSSRVILYCIQTFKSTQTMVAFPVPPDSMVIMYSLFTMREEIPESDKEIFRPRSGAFSP